MNQRPMRQLPARVDIAALPEPRAGHVITIPLGAWPEYRDAHELEITGRTRRGGQWLVVVRQKPQQDTK